MKRKFRMLLLGALLAAGWQNAAAQSVVAGAGFETRFDNREYSGNRFAESETIFGVLFQPEVGVQWAGRNRLMAGLSVQHDFGSEARFLHAVDPVIYYQFEAPKVSVDAGMFPRSKMLGRYSEAFFDRGVSFWHNRIQGLLVNWHRDRDYAEFVIDWEGLRSQTRREKFRILSEGHWEGRCFFGGWSLMMLHYAKTLNEEADEGVVDNLLVNPHAGIRFHAGVDFEIRAGYLQSLQRDRRVEQGWLTPKGGELHIRLSRWNFALDNQLFVGENMLPLYDLYGADLYECSTFFGVTGHVYNRTELSYKRSFFDRTLTVDAGIVFHYDGAGLGTQQLLKISVDLEKIWSRKK